MKLRERNFLGFNHHVIEAKYKDIKFVSEVPIRFKTDRGETHLPCAVYKNLNPNRPEYKDYMLLFFAGDNYMRSSKTEKEMFSQWIHIGIHCKSCGEVLISLDRHDNISCECENHATIDGGKGAMRYGARDINQVEKVTVNLKNGSIRVMDK
jgi:hypothetical protein